MDRIQFRQITTVANIMRCRAALVDSQLTPILRFGRRFGRGLFLLAVLMGLWFLVFPPKRLKPGDLHPSIPCLLIGGLPLLLPYLANFYTKHTLRKNLTQATKNDLWTEWTFTPEHVAMRDPMSQSELRWEAVAMFVEDGDGFLLKWSPTSGSWIDSSSFVSEAEAMAVASWAKARAITFRRKRPIAIDTEKVKVFSLDEL